MVVTAETMEEGEAMGEPVFQVKRKDIVRASERRQKLLQQSPSAYRNS